jgi:hypothetical protein
VFGETQTRKGLSGYYLSSVAVSKMVPGFPGAVMRSPDPFLPFSQTAEVSNGRYMPYYFNRDATACCLEVIGKIYDRRDFRSRWSRFVWPETAAPRTRHTSRTGEIGMIARRK